MAMRDICIRIGNSYYADGDTWSPSKHQAIVYHVVMGEDYLAFDNGIKYGLISHGGNQYELVLPLFNEKLAMHKNGRHHTVLTIESVGAQDGLCVVN